MAIFSAKYNTPVVEQTEDSFVDMYPFIEGTTECGYDIAAEGYSDIHKLVSSMYITDILIENAVMEGAEAEPLIEGAIKDFKDKAVKKFKEIIEKIKNWFKKIIDRLKVRFTSTKDFVNKYRDALRTKAKNSQGYKVTRHKFNHNVSSTLSTMLDKIETFAIRTAFAHDSSDFTADMAAAADSKAKSISDLKKVIVDKHVGKEVTNTTIGSDVEEMIKFCDNSKVAVAELETLRDISVKHVNNFIKEIQGSGDDSARVTKMVSNCNTATSAMQQLNTTCAKIVDDIVKEYVALLRGLMLYKPAKESYTPDEELIDNKGQSMFEAALNLF